MRLPKFASATCPNCHTLHERVPVEYEGDGDHIVGHVDLDVTGCADDRCTVKLCSCCPQFTCDFCGLKLCLEHAIDYSGDRICPCCMAVEVADAEVEAAPQVA